MSDLTSLANQLDAKGCQCRAIIETPKGFRNKFKYDPDSEHFKLGGLLPEGMMLPFDSGSSPPPLGVMAIHSTSWYSWTHLRTSGV